MGQTLEHGVYLPDEGERNCYAGLAANWQILDTSVGTIAEHTSALSDKAPLVHTHSKSDITDFPAYGNAAGTICEGNDARLSDARTPTAHTHTKSDVTDLLNSNFIPSANNSYDLGSSSYQWNNVYSKGYYYNGTPWGLDKANEWTQNQTVKNGSASYVLVNTNITKGVIPTNNRNITFSAKDTNGEEIGRLLTRVTPNGETYTWLAAHNFYKNGALNPTGTEKWANITCFISSDGSTHVETNGDFIPDNGTTNANLGISTNKWKTLNGINPGALSLPDYSSVVNVDTTGWSTSAGRIAYTPALTGWLQIAIPNDIDNNNEKSNFITIMDTDIPNDGFNNPSGITSGNSNDYRIQVMFPVVANKTYHIYIKSYSGLISAVKFTPCLGNV